MARTKRALAVVATLALLVAGIFFWWPFAVLGVVVAVLIAPVAGIVLALLLDILWGAPSGALHVLYFPWTLLALALAAVRVAGPRFFFSRGSDTL